jgi:parallel beta-helix repeat protein
MRWFGVLVVAGLLAVLAVAGTGVAQSGQIPPEGADCEEHPPIEITENTGSQGFVLGPEVDGFALPTYRPGSGVVGGLGTATSPYLIEDWCITPDPDRWPFVGADDAQAAIEIRGTDAHVLVRGNVFAKEGSFEHGVEILNAANVEVRGNVVDGNDAVGVTVGGSGPVQVADNEIIDNGGVGVHVEDGGSASVTDNAIEANEGTGVELVDTSGLTVQGNEFADDAGGILLRRSQSTEVRGNVIQDSASGDGIELASADDNTIAGNEISGTATGIVLVGASTANAIEANTIATVGGYGIGLFRSPDNAVQDNRIQDGFGDGILVESTGTAVTGNTLVGNDRGIVVAEPTDRVEANTVQGHRVGVRMAHGQPGVFAANDVSGNQVGLEIENLGSRLDARDNWWGDASGPSGGVTDACTGTVADGSGDAIASVDDSEVCFDPWLTGAASG